MAYLFVWVQTIVMVTYVVLFQSFIMLEATEPMCSKFHYDEQLLEKMIRTEIKVESLDQGIKKTEEKVVTTLETLQKDVRDNQKLAESTIKEQLDNLSKENEAFKKELETLMNESKSEVSRATNTVADTLRQQEAQIARMSQDLRKLENDTIEKLKEVALTPTVIFKARDMTDTSPSSNEKLVFKTNLFNIGEAYDNSTGIFTAPVSGIYLFSVHLCTCCKARYIIYSIEVNDDTITEADVGDDGYTICDESDAMVHMTKGMTAWVKHKSGSGYNSGSSPWNTFSGLLVHI